MALYRVRPWGNRIRRTWDPWRDMEELRRAMEQVAARAEAPDVASETGPFVPDVDLYEADMTLVVRVDLPGMRPADVTVAIDHGVLKIEGHRPSEGLREKTYLCYERRCGRFVRSLPLPAGVAPELAKATLSDGVLEIILPKAEGPAAQGVMVKIEVVDAKGLGDVADLS